MTVAFTDNFNRSDGVPGPDWTVATGTWAIVGNTLKSTVAGRIRCNTSPAGANAAAFMTVPGYAGSVKAYAFRLRESLDGTYYVAVQFILSATTISVSIIEAAGGSPTTLATRTVPYSYGTTVYLMAAIADVTAMGNVDSGDYLSAITTGVPDAGGVSIQTSYSNSVLDDFWLYDLNDKARTVEVSGTTDENEHYTVTLYDPAASWITGTPGSPLFECKAGTIISQEITDPDTAVLVYDPPDVDLAEVFLDPYNGVQYHAKINVPASLNGEGGGGGGLTETQSETLDGLADYLADYATGNWGVQGAWLKLGSISLLAGSAWGETDGSAFGDMLAQLLDQAGSLRLAETYAHNAQDALTALTDGGNWDLQYTWGQIKGAENRDLSAVYDLVAALDIPDPADLTLVLSHLVALRTANNWTLDNVKGWIDAIPADSNQDVLDELARIRTANNWSLGTIVDLIDGLTIPDYGDQLDTIDQHVLAIPTNPVTSLQPVEDAISAHNTNLNNKAQAVLDAIANIPTNPLTSLQPVLDAIAVLSGDLSDAEQAILDAIAAIANPTAARVPPIWPGIANVTLGTPVSLAEGLTITVPMDGVIIELSSVGSAIEYLSFNDKPSYFHLGAVAFEDDNGAIEGFQQFTFGKQNLCPRRMLRAARVHIRTHQAVSGTATPWTITGA